MRAIYTLLLLLTTFQITGQTEYKKGFVSLSIPVILDHEKITVNFAQGKRFVKNENQETHIQVRANLDDIKINGNSFSGLSIVEFPVYQEIVAFQGTFSEDKQSIDKMHIDYQFIKYSQPNRSIARIEETKSGSFEFSNLPKDYSGYGFEFGKSEINKIEFERFLFLKYTGMSETTRESASSPNKEKFNKYMTGIKMTLRDSDFKPSKHTYDKIAVTTSQDISVLEDSLLVEIPAENKKNDASLTMGISALLIHKLSQLEGVKILERLKLDELLAEQELSESGLVSDESRVETGRMIEEDILIVIELSEVFKNDEDEVIGWLITPLVIEKSSGKVIDLGLKTRFNKDSLRIDQLIYFVNGIYYKLRKDFI